MTGERAEYVEAKLDTIIRLLARLCVEGQSKNESIITLGKLNLDRDVIATVCDTTPHAVSVRLSEAKRRSTRKRAGKKVSVERAEG